MDDSGFAAQLNRGLGKSEDTREQCSLSSWYIEHELFAPRADSQELRQVVPGVAKPSPRFWYFCDKSTGGCIASVLEGVRWVGKSEVLSSCVDSG